MHVVISPTEDYSGQLNILLVTGQSLGKGVSETGSALSVVQPYGNMTLTAADGELTRLTEPALCTDPNNAVETIISGCLNLLTVLLRRAGNTNNAFVGFSCAEGGAAYSKIKKGGNGDAYQDGIDVVTHICSLASGGGVVNACCLIHGEQDSVIETADYDDCIIEMQGDYDTDLKSITEQSATIPLFLCQMSSWTNTGDTTSIIPHLQLAAADADENVHLVCPKYHLGYNESVHMLPASYRQLGEHYAVAIYNQLYGDGWQPLQPLSVTRSGAVVTATFNVPSGGTLVLDDTNVDDPGDYGFEWYDAGDGNSVDISSVELDGTDSVTVTLDDTPTGTGQALRYAYTGVASNHPGPTTGARGCLRDDDTRYLSRHGYNLWNWCVHFEMDVS